MNRRVFCSSLGTAVIALVLFGCSLTTMAGEQDNAATMVAETVSVLQADLTGSQTAAAGVLPPAATQSPPLAPLPTAQAQTIPTAANPIVSSTTLCWTGPGNAYPVVSSVKAGTAVEVLGVGSNVNWFIIKNPTYGDRCWLEARSLTLDPNFTTAGLEVFNPPPTPGPKVTPMPTPT